MLPDRVEITVRPAIIAPLGDDRELLGGHVRAFILRVELGPVLEQHVAPLLHRIKLPIHRIDCQRDEVAVSRRVMRPARLRLVRATGVKRPHAGSDRQLGAREDARRLGDAVRDLTRVRRRADVDEQLPMIREEHCLADVITRIWQARDHCFSSVGRREAS